MLKKLVLAIFLVSSLQATGPTNKKPALFVSPFVISLVLANLRSASAYDYSDVSVTEDAIKAVGGLFLLSMISLFLNAQRR